MFKNWREWAPLPLRLVLGLGYMYHGYPKLFSAEGHASIMGMLQNMGVPAPGPMSWVVGFTEFVGGLALVVGALVTLVSFVLGASLVVNILIAMFRGGFPQPLPGQQPLPGYETSLAYIAGLLALIIGGAGVYSIDRMLAAKRSDARSKMRESA
jgi:putative oxidoreductase